MLPYNILHELYVLFNDRQLFAHGLGFCFLVLIIKSLMTCNPLSSNNSHAKFISLYILSNSQWWKLQEYACLETGAWFNIKVSMFIYLNMEQNNDHGKL